MNIQKTHPTPVPPLFSVGGRTPLRDQLNINPEDEYAESELGGRAEKQRSRAAAVQLRSQLGSLPEPQFAYDIVVPNVAGEEDDWEKQVEDAADRDARLKAAEAAAAETVDRGRPGTAARRAH